MLVDTHAHLEAVDDLERLLLRAKEAGLGKIITIGTSLESSKKAIVIAEKYSDSDLQLYTTCGIHPEDGKGDIGKFGSIEKCISKLRKIIKSSKKVIGVGETGLDYHLGTSDQRPVTTYDDKKFQRELFETQIKLATDLELPIVVHCRNAWDEIFEILTVNSQKLKAKDVFHSWTGNWQAAQKALDLGFYISFSGIVTFANAADIAEVAKKAPIGRILIETDSPFLSPEPLRGRKNEPKNVKITADFIAKLRGLSPYKIMGVTTLNANEVFGI